MPLMLEQSWQRYTMTWICSPFELHQYWRLSISIGRGLYENNVFSVTTVCFIEGLLGERDMQTSSNLATLIRE